jgi:predicted nucleic acid-binding protein
VGRVARYLADKSALGRLGKPAVSAILAPLIQQGIVAICGAVELEMLFNARNVTDHDRMRTYLQAFEWLAIFDDCWDRAIDVHRELAARGRHRAVPMPDLLVAATAERHGVTVLHYDADFEVIAEVTGQLTRWVVPRGTAD